MVEIWINGEPLELEETSIKYTKQIADVLDMGMIKTSHTNSFIIPKTYRNTRIFQGLGLVGDTSDVPYTKTQAQLKYSGFDVIYNGWLDITETSDNYKINIKDGIIDFIKLLENKSLGKELDLSEINHIKNIDTVIASFTNENYRYIIANYGGLTSGNGYIFIDHLVPSARIKYLWDKMFNHLGWTYSGTIFSNPDFDNAWQTFPSTDVDEIINRSALAIKGYFEETPPTFINPLLQPNHPLGGYFVYDNIKVWDYQTIVQPNYISIIDNWTIKVNETGKFKIKITTAGYTRYLNSTHREMYIGVLYGTTMEIHPVPLGDYFDFEVTPILSQNSNIRVYFCTPYPTIRLFHQYTTITVSRVDGDDYSFSNNLIDYQLKDFFKEQIVRFGLTPIVDTDSKHIMFLTQDEKIDLSNTVDWSKKYVKRNKENYIYGSYAQENWFRHRYDQEDEYYSDGKVVVNNQNLEATKTLYQSRTISKGQDLYRFPMLPDDYPVFIYPFYVKEPKEDENGDTVIDYKGLTNRFFIMKSKYLYLDNPIMLYSRKTGELEAVTYLPMADSENTHFNELVPKYYPKYQGLIGRPRIHEIELALNILDISNIDFTKVYYFEQEASYYVLNRIIWQDKNTCQGEFIKIN